MRRVLHILTRPDDTLGPEIIARQKDGLAVEVEVMDLRTARPDYKKLLEKIFDSDSVETW
ncbi:MAG: hypothetical protein ACLQVY_06695 [Limisphaerales bacterium]